MPIYKTYKQETYTQADGAVIINSANQNVWGHQVTLGGNSTVGTLSFEVKYHPKGVWETLYEDDNTTQKVIDIATPRTFIATGLINSFRITPTGVDGNYSVIVISGVDENNE